MSKKIRMKLRRHAYMLKFINTKVLDHFYEKNMGEVENS
jgi:hypothetical protein